MFEKWNSKIAKIENENGVSKFILDVDNSTVTYSKKVNNKEDVIDALKKSIKILTTFIKYSKQTAELKEILEIEMAAI